MPSPTSKHTSTETEMFAIPEVEDSSLSDGVNPLMPDSSQKQGRSNTGTHLANNGSTGALDDRAKCNTTEEHLTGSNGAMVSKSLARTDEAAMAIPQTNSGGITSVNGMLQSNPAYDPIRPTNGSQPSGSNGAAPVQGANSSARTIEAGFNPVPNGAEDPAPLSGDESSLNTKCVVQDSEAAEAPDTNRPITYRPMLDCPFTLTVAAAPSLGLPVANENTDPWKSNMIYVVRPQTLWNIMNIFRSAIVDGTEYFIQQKVFIRVTQPDNLDILRIGHILEIKSLDPFHTYIRVFWMYKPQDLPLATTQQHFEDSELIASNHMGVVAASRIVQPVTVARWREAGGRPVPSGSLFWRQHYDVLTKQLCVPA